MRSKSSENGLEFNINGKSLLRFALPTILSNIFMIAYGQVDSLFVANVIGTDGLSTINIVFPMIIIALSISTMIATGGSALTGKMLGEGKNKEACGTFTFLLIFAFALSIAFSVVCFVFREPLLMRMGADEALYPICEEYAVPLFFFMPAAMCGMMCQMFFVTSGLPKVSFTLSAIAGVTNIALDALLLIVFPLGIRGAAYATGIGYLFQAVAGIIYFALSKKGLLHFARPLFSLKTLIKSCSNGMSEMVGMLSGSVTAIALNIILMNLAGSEGVAASAVADSALNILSSAYIGYMEGIGPVISYNYGKGDHDRLHRIYVSALRTVGVIGMASFILSYPLARPIAILYSDGVENVLNLAIQSVYIFAPSFMLCGFNRFSSAFFTALNNGKISAVLSFFRTFVFYIIPLLILPRFFGVTGVWLASPVCEAMAILLTVFFLKKYRKVYKY